jgi:hypothetical protein
VHTPTGAAKKSLPEPWMARLPDLLLWVSDAGIARGMSYSNRAPIQPFRSSGVRRKHRACCYGRVTRTRPPAQTLLRRVERGSAASGRLAESRKHQQKQ